MNKIKIKGYLKNLTIEAEEYTDFEFIGDKENNSLSYKEKDVLVNIKINKNNIYLTRETDDLLIKFIFSLDKNTKGTYYLKDMNKNMSLEVFTDEYQVFDNFFLIKYYLTLEEEYLGAFEFTLKWELIK